MKLHNGYETRTTFWEDFTIAEHFGLDAIMDTFNRAFNEWKDDVIYMTELTIIMNLKCWYWYDDDHKQEVWSRTYAELFCQCRDYGYDHFTGDDLTYFWSTLD